MSNVMPEKSEKYAFVESNVDCLYLYKESLVSSQNSRTTQTTQFLVRNQLCKNHIMDFELCSL